MYLSAYLKRSKEFSGVVINKLLETFLFGNYFYGLCAVALAIETSFQLHLPFNSLLLYITLFFGSIVYYTKAYLCEKYHDRYNRRSVWYSLHYHLINKRQTLFLIIALVAAICYLLKYADGLANIPVKGWLLLLVFPVVAVCYYNIPVFRFFGSNLRRTGWAKPFVIGLVWAGAATIYPAIAIKIENGASVLLPPAIGWFFVKNWIFITILCIMFDIKDYASDSNNNLKTFIVSWGLRKTIRRIILPLTCIAYFSFIVYAVQNHFHITRVVINTIPFFLLVVVAFSLYKRKSIMYYLAVIDGLMLIKALCGIAGILWMSFE